MDCGMFFLSILHVSDYYPARNPFRWETIQSMRSHVQYGEELCVIAMLKEHDHVSTDSTILPQPHGAGDETGRNKKALEAVNEDLRVANEELEAMNEEIRGAERARRGHALLAESESRFRTIVENANEIIYVLDDEGVFLFVSPAWTKYLGHPVDDVVDGRSSCLCTKTISCFAAIFLRRFCRGKSARGIEYRVLHKKRCVDMAYIQRIDDAR